MFNTRKAITGGALVLGALTAGAIGASMFSSTANAATGSGSSSTSSTSAPAAAPAAPGSTGSTGSGTTPNRPAPDWSKGGHQANGKTETLLTGDTLAKAEAAAKAAVPGATPQRAETDAEGATYEVHMTKSDGSVVTVKLDANFKVTKTINGMG